MLHYTGHPLVDVGVAAITAFAGKRDPAQVNGKDMEQVGGFIEQLYFGEWRNWMFVLLPNSAYTQPKLSGEKRESFCKTFIYGFREAHETDERCVFCGQASLARGFRQNIPLLTGEGTVNFFPWGHTGLPACGACLLAIQAFPLGSVRCSGRALFVHSDDDTMILEFASRFLTQNRKSLTLDVSHPRTYLVAQLLEIEAKRVEALEGPCSVTAYHLTNYGTNPDIALYHLPSHLVSFLRKARRAPHGDTWRQIEQRAWELSIEKARGKRRGKAEAEQPAAPTQFREEPGQARNYLYEDLFQLPQDAGRFVRTYLLRRVYRSRFEEDPRRTYSLQRELNLVSWTLTDIFLKEVMNVEQHRIETIRNVADRLAGSISTGNDRQLFRDLWMSSRYIDLRRALIRADRRSVSEGKDPLLTFEDFVTIFEFGEEAQRPDWQLARDLVLIRVVEQLHKEGWFAGQPEAVEDEEAPEAEEAAE